MSIAILHLGSNLGDRIANLDKALGLLANQLAIQCPSSIYATEAWGIADQPAFYNQAVSFNTDYSPFELLNICREVGTAFPEKEGERWGPRHMDIDIIFYSDHVIDSDLLKIPHPRMHLRNFVLIPLLEIAPDYIHPVFNKTIEELYIESEDALEVRLVRFM